MPVVKILDATTGEDISGRVADHEHNSELLRKALSHVPVSGTLDCYTTDPPQVDSTGENPCCRDESVTIVECVSARQA